MAKKKGKGKDIRIRLTPRETEPLDRYIATRTREQPSLGDFSRSRAVQELYWEQLKQLGYVQDSP